MRFKWLSVAFCLSAVLSGCRIGEPNRLAFATDSRIFRGHYSGAVDTRFASNVTALSADNAVLAMGGGDGRAVVQLWSTATQTPVKSLGTVSETAWFVRDVAITADGSMVGSLLENRVQLWNTQTGVQRTLDTGAVSENCRFCYVQFDLSSDGRYAAVGGKYIALFDAQTGTPLRSFEFPGESLETLIFSADGTRLAALAAGSSEGDTPKFRVRVWDTVTGGGVFMGSSSAGEAWPLQLALSADGKRLALTSGDAVRIFDFGTQQLISTLELPQDFGGLALNPDGSQLSVATFGYGEAAPTTTTIFAANTGARLAELKGVYLGEWSQDGTLILAYGDLEKHEGPALLDAVTFEKVGEFVNGKLHQVTLEATPNYVDVQHYTVDGTLTLDGGPSITFTGQVKGNESQRYLAPQARLPYPAELTLELQGNPWTLHGWQPWRSPDGTFGVQQDHAWTGYVMDTSQPMTSYSGDGTLTLDPIDGSR